LGLRCVLFLQPKKNNPRTSDTNCG
jgi:hypothetical protein